jgi:hypothetical protein
MLYLSGGQNEIRRFDVERDRKSIPCYFGIVPEQKETGDTSENS